MSRINMADFAIVLGASKNTTYSGVNKFGRNVDVDTAAAEDIWDGGGTWVAPTTARTHDLVSTDIGDTQDIVVQGLGSDWSTQTETVTLTGTTNAPTANTYQRIFRMYNAGSTDLAGTVTATAQTDATVTAQITVGNNQTAMSIYTVPLNKILVLTSVWGSLNAASPAGVLVDTSLYMRSSGGVWRIQHQSGVISDGSSHYFHPFDPYPSYSAKTDLKISASVSANGTSLSTGFDGVLLPA